MPTSMKNIIILLFGIDLDLITKMFKLDLDIVVTY